MSPNRMNLRLSVGLLILLIGWPAVAQDMKDLKFFAPADTSTYGSGQKPKEGYFFSFEGLSWYISPAKETLVGAAGTREVWFGPAFAPNLADPNNPAAGTWLQTARQSSTLDTGFLDTSSTSGNRIEFGRIVDRKGWYFSTYRLNSLNHRHAASNVDMVFIDPDTIPVDPITGEFRRVLQGPVGEGPDPTAPPPANPGDPVATIPYILDVPVTFKDVLTRNSVDTWSVELMLLGRSRPFHFGANLEWFAGVRYMEFDEVFSVAATGDIVAAVPPAVGIISALANSNWDTEAENHVIGPQFGIRWWHQRKRWTFSTEGRFMVGFNSQNLRQKGLLGDQLTPPIDPTTDLFQPALLGPTYFNYAEHPTEWTPVIELRAELKYQVTRAITLKVGWTGIWMDNIARASDLINYQVNSAGDMMGLLPQNNRDDVFTHGLTIGFDVNR